MYLMTGTVSLSNNPGLGGPRPRWGSINHCSTKLTVFLGCQEVSVQQTALPSTANKSVYSSLSKLHPSLR